MEIVINKDIRKIKNKDILGMTFKEAGFAVLACAIGGGIALLQTKVLRIEKPNYLIAIIPMAIPLAFGFLKPLGMTFWEFIKTFCVENFFTPKTYINNLEHEDEIVLDYEELLKVYDECYLIEQEGETNLLSDFKIDKTSPEWKKELKNSANLGF